MTHAQRRRRTAAIYRKAARLIETGERGLSCCAVMHAKHGDHRWVEVNAYTDAACIKYGSIMSKDEGGRVTSWQFTEAEDEGCGNGQDLRILALCFMAAITERP